MKLKFILMLGAFSTLGFSQTGNVGINTTEPHATLDIKGNLKVRNVSDLLSLQTDQDILILDKTTSGDYEVKKINADYFKNGLLKNTTMYAAQKESNLSLLTASLYAGYQAIKFLNTDISVGDLSLGLFTSTSTDSYYTVPSDGVYSISFAFTYGNGIQAALFSSNPKVGILRQLYGTSGSGSYTVLDSFTFAGVNLGLIDISISQGSINGLYNLKQGDNIYFAVDQGGISLGLLSSSKASFSIYKVSNPL